MKKDKEDMNKENKIKKIERDDPITKSADIVSENIAKLKSLFPELITEGPEGFSINIDVLKQLVGDERTLTDCDEKYGLNWFGKRRARQLALTPSTGTLRPAKDESEDWDNTQNIFIEGDNLEVLKLLQKSYAGKVKMIYIDPPYNTGKDFIYKDDFRDNIQNYKRLTGQVDEEGSPLTSNPETSGRFHTDWLNMMYPRLKLARNLLREDGVIFISIDDNEVANLRKICDEIFGEENFIAHVLWQKKFSPQNDATYFSDMHDHILVYAKQKQSNKNDPHGWILDKLPRTKDQNKRYKNPDNDPRGPWMSSDLSVKTYSASYDYPITTPSGRIVNPPQGYCWRVSKTRLDELIRKNRIWFGPEGNSVPRLKRFLSEIQNGRVPTTWWTYQEVGHNQEAKQELKRLMDGIDIVFDTPKPVKLLKRMLYLATKSCPDTIVMDFFAGSGTLGQATMEFNAEEDSGKRRFLLVQIPEPVNDSKFKTIAELAKERLRRAAKKIKEEHPDWNGDTGFRVFKLDSSNIKAWNPNLSDKAGDSEYIQREIEDSIDNILPDRTEEDILYELLLKLGLDLCVPIETKKIAGKIVYSIGGGVLIVCLDKKIMANEVEELGQGIVKWHKELDPVGETTCIFRDSAFENDVAKTNLAAFLDQNGISNVRSL